MTFHLEKVVFKEYRRRILARRQRAQGVADSTAEQQA
jgi:hypothetical protein